MSLIGPAGLLVIWALVVLVAVLVALVAWAYQTANRLNRLHVRCDLSWQALDGALARRAVVARAVAVETYPGGSADQTAGRRLALLADIAERAPRPTREAAENELSAALSLVDPASLPTAMVAELADAETRVLLARRFHNDAVRDTVALRERPLVRLLHLGGTAPLPTYFEIAERTELTARVDHGVLERRTSARVVLLDDDGSVLLLCGSDPALDDAEEPAPRWWFTVGGQTLPGERLAQAAARELAEETGLRAAEWQRFGSINCADSLTNHVVHLFVATGLTQGEAALDPGEADLSVLRLPFRRAVGMAMRDEIPDAGSAHALVRYAAERAGIG